MAGKKKKKEEFDGIKATVASRPGTQNRWRVDVVGDVSFDMKEDAEETTVVIGVGHNWREDPSSRITAFEITLDELKSVVEQVESGGASDDGADDDEKPKKGKKKDKKKKDKEDDPAPEPEPKKKDKKGKKDKKKKKKDK